MMETETVAQPTPGYTEVGTTEQMASLYEALSAAQGAFGEIRRSRTVTIRTNAGAAYSFSYAPLEDLLAATRPALAANGLTVLTPIVRMGAADAQVLVVVGHKGGGRLISAFSFTPRGDMKEVAGQITYLRRYGYSAALNLAADDDDDDAPPATPAPGRAQKRQEPAPTLPPARPADEPPKGAEPPAASPPSDGAVVSSQPRVETISDPNDPLWQGWLKLRQMAVDEGVTDMPALGLPVKRDDLELCGRDLKESIKNQRTKSAS